MNDNLSKVKYLMSNYQYSIEDAGLNGRNSLIFHISGDKLLNFLTSTFTSSGTEGALAKLAKFAKLTPEFFLKYSKSICSGKSP